ncbi:MAG: CBS domain-containing protein [Bacteroidetes bacterium]|nr:CBS domain-containing protein [Bacteroidota bacterium]
MSTKQLITYDLPTLSYSDSGEKALHLMNEFRVFHLPLVQGDNYIALISEDDLLDWDTPEEPLSLAEFITFRPAIMASKHAFEAMKLVKAFGLSVLPVVDDHNHYMGLITIESLLSVIADSNAVMETGAIMVLEMDQRNYSLSEIARICESNDITILASFIKAIDDTGLQRVTLKLNKTDVQSVLATFERYSYQVVEVYAAENHKENLKENFDLLMHYLNT